MNGPQGDTSEPTVHFREGFREGDPHLGVWLYLVEDPSQQAFDELLGLLNGWYVVGFYGGYGGGGFHYMSDISLVKEKGRPLVRLNIDMGSRFGPQSIEVLRRALVGWARLKTWKPKPPHVGPVGVQVERIELGAPEQVGPRLS